MHRLPGPCRPYDEHDADAIHIYILKERRPCARFEDVEVLRIEVFRVRVPDMRSEHRGEASMMVLGEPQWEDIELVIAREHRVEGGEIAKGFLHHLSPCIHKHSMDGRNDVS